MGGDLMLSDIVCVSCEFQSTPPHGGRLPTPDEIALILVSIHAPAWGATKFAGRVDDVMMFQSTPPHGGRLKSLAISVYRLEFQSTPPHGGRRGRYGKG